MLKGETNINFFIKKRMKDLRLKAGLTQEQFSEISGISYKYAQSIEAGRISNLRLKTIYKIASTFRLEIYQFFSPKLPSVKALKKVIPPHKPRHGVKAQKTLNRRISK